MKQFISPKYFLLFIIIIACNKSHAQVTLDFAAGYSTVNSLLVNAAAGYAYHNKAVLQGEMIVMYNDDQPAYFGLHAGYNFQLSEDCTVQPFLTRFYELFSTDKYDAYKNHWCNGYGLKFYYNPAQSNLFSNTTFSFGAQRAGKQFTNESKGNYIFSFGAVERF